MSQNQEIIESKLCAYIDGELDTEGRAEIEKHLEANPQHRRLLESLRATRDLLRWLPREPAPAEIAETLNGQLERSVLLNYEGEHLGPSIWPKVFAAAAIVTLTAGLGVAVYYALPRSQSPAQLALHTAAEPESGNADVVPAPLATTEESSRNEAAHAGGAERDREAYASKAGPSRMALGEPATLTPSARQDLADQAKMPERLSVGQKKSDELEQLARQVGQNPSAFVAAASNGFGLNANAVQNANPTAATPLVLLVKSDAPEQTERQVTAYLNEQQIQWRQAPQASPANAAPAPAAVAPVTQPAAPAEAVAAKNESSNSANGTLGAPQNNIAGSQVAQQQQQQPRQETSQNAIANNVRFAENVYVCQMSRRQAAQLSNTIATSTTPVAQVQDLSRAANSIVNAAPGEAPASTNAVAQRGVAGGAGASGFGAGRSGAAEDRARSMKTAAGGAEAEQLAVAPSAATAKDAQNAASAPAPVLSKADAREGATTQPAPAQAAGLAPTPGSAATQPAAVAAGPTTAPADEPVNVVILVQANPAAPSNAPAAPAPAAPPAAAAQPPSQQSQQSPATTSQSQQQQQPR
jgi:hypothetical protein